MLDIGSSTDIRSRTLAATYRREIGLCSATDLYNQSFVNCYNHDGLILIANGDIIDFFTERPKGKIVLLNKSTDIKGSGEASKVIITFSPVEEGSTVLEVRQEHFVDNLIGVEHRSVPITFLDTTERNERDDYIFMDLNHNEIGYICNQVAQNLAAILQFQVETFKPYIRTFSGYVKDVKACVFANEVK